MKIAMVASEAAPYVKTGGLGDVMQALPPELAGLEDNEVCLFLPYYKRVKSNETLPVEPVGAFHMELAWREVYVGIVRLRTAHERLHVYFIDNDYYFGSRSTIYGDFDDGERFAYFSKAVMAALYYLDFKPDVLHCHDWQAAMTPIYCRALYGQWCPHTRTVFTIHNVEYQGWADADFFDNILGLPEAYRSRLLFDGAVNMMKGALETADIVTTVSKTYAQELCYPTMPTALTGCCGRSGSGASPTALTPASMIRPPTRRLRSAMRSETWRARQRTSKPCAGSWGFLRLRMRRFWRW